MKKFIVYIIMFFMCFSVFAPAIETEALSLSDNILIMETTDLEKLESNCRDFSPALRIGGYIIFWVKIILPLIIIVKGSFDLAKVVTSGKPEELKKGATKMGYSAVASIIIFFIPTIIYTVFGFIDSFNENMTEDSKICSACIFDPFGDLCETSVNSSKSGASN